MLRQAERSVRQDQARSSEVSVKKDPWVISSGVNSDKEEG